jgi:hypothetical protein
MDRADSFDQNDKLERRNFWTSDFGWISLFSAEQHGLRTAVKYGKETPGGVRWVRMKKNDFDIDSP